MPIPVAQSLPYVAKGLPILKHTLLLHKTLLLFVLLIFNNNTWIVFQSYYLLSTVEKGGRAAVLQFPASPRSAGHQEAADSVYSVDS